ncbi:AAA family ATPase [Exiguobacterium sp. s146]|uniref:AAA family ATPase n=1 Tax=Exiguobacterium sp. s146 TaxID=2751223 RepID=UPI001BEB6AAA|nr:AAA family ATPase [Exiguobacterium sp. s146]
MESIRVKNLRSLEDTGDVSLAPLVVLLGKNSSGKSTFLRTFPLLKQSIMTPITEPILWYSDKSVDFGDFETSINKYKKLSNEPISFDFKFKTLAASMYYGNPISRSRPKEYLDIKLHVEVLKKRFKKIQVQILDQKFELTARTFDDKTPDSFTLVINEIPLNIEFSQETNNSFYGRNFLPVIVPELKIKMERNRVRIRHVNGLFIDYIVNEIKKIILPYFDNLIEENPDNYLNTIRNDEFESDKDFILSAQIEEFISELNINYLKEVGNKDYQFFYEIQERYINRMKKSNSKIVKTPYNIFLEALNIASEKEKAEINTLLLSIYWKMIVDICNEYLVGYFGKVHYIAPVRASAQRYYRTQGLAVEEIDPQGENIPMAINNMNDGEKRKFRKWTKINFGFEIFTKENGGHVSLQIQFDDNNVMNLTDTGFGFSQILPIILLIWRANELTINNSNSINSNANLINNNQYPTTIVIEQPELHLHPHLQAKLCEVLVKCINYTNPKRTKTRFIIETHSETIINKLGQLIFEKELESNQVNIMAFGLSKSDSENSIKNIPFNEEGLLEQWPADFLMEDF